MCLTCHKENIEAHGPAAFNEKTHLTVELCREQYEISCVGGALHIFMDDDNIYDQNIEFCKASAETELEHKICDLLAQMSLRERIGVLAELHGYQEI